jgi:hypothetical protein
MTKEKREEREQMIGIYEALNEMMPEELKGGAIYWTDGLWIYPDGTTEYL